MAWKSRFILVGILIIIVASAWNRLEEFKDQFWSDINNISQQVEKTPSKSDGQYDVKLKFPADKYPETARHIKNAIKKGASAVCTIDREGADENREKSLKNIPTKRGYDRDEYPMAMCEEGGAGADIEYISPSDNRGAGSWVSHQLSEYEDGTAVLFVVD
ncbi:MULTISPECIES: NucA/NucB deoxyribonuclease domain-containing protein [Bacillus]|uniref:NucA/NucB deoxyribonuclease domain-containing protein n=1 Tax=Bacillus TaxID=1386 RepID=UPI001F0FFCB2|nr:MULTISPECIES: NucA/NucB deoxyribonuclease domain-containing protein [Bacillus]MCY7576679.1 NucA/NucB deoxyribonuclease domain-containing protein [Bacillus pumilus]